MAEHETQQQDDAKSNNTKVDEQQFASTQEEEAQQHHLETVILAEDQPEDAQVIDIAQPNKKKPFFQNFKEQFGTKEFFNVCLLGVSFMLFFAAFGPSQVHQIYLHLFQVFYNDCVW